eukprot:ctg_603.g269
MATGTVRPLLRAHVGHAALDGARLSQPLHSVARPTRSLPHRSGRAARAHSAPGARSARARVRPAGGADYHGAPSRFRFLFGGLVEPHRCQRGQCQAPSLLPLLSQPPAASIVIEVRQRRFLLVELAQPLPLPGTRSAVVGQAVARAATGTVAPGRPALGAHHLRGLATGGRRRAGVAADTGTVAGHAPGPAAEPTDDHHHCRRGGAGGRGGRHDRRASEAPPGPQPPRCRYRAAGAGPQPHRGGGAATATPVRAATGASVLHIPVVGDRAVDSGGLLSATETQGNARRLARIAASDCEVQVWRRGQRPASDGVLERISSSELVPGDVFVIESGMTLPCDCTLLSGSAVVTEASLTGEASPLFKSAWRHAFEDPHAEEGVASPRSRVVGGAADEDDHDSDEEEWTSLQAAYFSGAYSLADDSEELLPTPAYHHLLMSTGLPVDVGGQAPAKSGERMGMATSRQRHRRLPEHYTAWDHAAHMLYCGTRVIEARVEEPAQRLPTHGGDAVPTALSTSAVGVLAVAVHTRMDTAKGTLMRDIFLADDDITRHEAAPSPRHEGALCDRFPGRRLLPAGVGASNVAVRGGAQRAGRGHHCGAAGVARGGYVRHRVRHRSPAPPRHPLHPPAGSAHRRRPGHALFRQNRHADRPRPGRVRAAAGAACGGRRCGNARRGAGHGVGVRAGGVLSPRARRRGDDDDGMGGATRPLHGLRCRIRSAVRAGGESVRIQQRAVADGRRGAGAGRAGISGPVLRVGVFGERRTRGGFDAVRCVDGAAPFWRRTAQLHGTRPAGASAGGQAAVAARP